VSLRLRVDGPRWRAHLAAVVADRPGIVPVVKGRGYGLGVDLLAGQAAALGVDTIAVGTLAEAVAAGRVFDGDLVVLEPWAGPGRDAPVDAGLRRRVVRTVGTVQTLEAVLAAVAAGTVVDPFVVEVETGMHRHGVPAAFAVAAARRLATARAASGPALRGFAVHLPIRTSRRDRRPGDVRALASALAEVVPGTTLWGSHLAAAGLGALAAEVPGLVVRERVGTRLWLGDTGVFAASALVVDVRSVELGTRLGYARRRARTRRVVVVAAGTAHGVGLAGEPMGLRRLVAVAALLAGARRSAFRWEGRRLDLADVPHMQECMLALPGGLRAPRIGDRMPCRVRLTTTVFDEVVVEGADDPASEPAADPLPAAAA
jgi:hypothetical protein